MIPMISRQEMFDRAVRGLRAQGYAQAFVRDYNEDGTCTGKRCVYLTRDGLRCAWGHVDTSLDGHDEGGVQRMRNNGRGLAKDLDIDDLRFAEKLQDCHDSARGPAEMEMDLQELGRLYDLTWPV